MTQVPGLLKKAVSLRQGYGRQASGVPCLRRIAASRRQVGALSSFAVTDLALFAPFALSYSMYAAGAKSPAALLDSLFQQPLFPPATGRMLERLLGIEKIFELFNGPVPQNPPKNYTIIPGTCFTKKRSVPTLR